ncbi:transcription factor Opi1-domain-containing protein [Phycomyces nitens]|nr:transcription factor Opi1-domain-containing protein [Phycomyces nitens]
MTSPSPMSITQLVHSEQDRDVKLPAEVLEPMAPKENSHNKRPFPGPLITLPPLNHYPPTPSTTPSSPLPAPILGLNPCYSFTDSTLEDDPHQTLPHHRHHLHHMHQQQHFMHRVSNIPLVNSALRAYESSKASSSVVKYGAEMVESFAAPIYDKVGKRVLSGAVDEWGCKQLDKLEERYPRYVSSPDDQEDPTMAAASALARASLTDEYEGGRRRREDSREDQTYCPRTRSRSASRSASRSTSPRRPYNLATKTTAIRHRTQPIGKSKWHQIVMHAGSAAGTTAAVISEESMKCLRYCLSWLEYATQNIDHQMNILRSFLVALATHADQSQPPPAATTTVAQSNPTSSSSTLAVIKKEIIDTLRKVVEVVSRYAGSGLPEQAKASVRGFILALPGRWAVLNSGVPAALDGPANESDVDETSIRLLNFGGESIEMLQSVSNVFSDTIERAELWLERLRVVGVAGVSRPEKSGDAMETVPEQPNESMDLS